MPPILPGDPAGPGGRAGLGHHISSRSIAASAEVVGKLAGGTEGAELGPRERKSYESWILGGMGMAMGLQSAAWLIHLLPSRIQIVAHKAWPTSRR
jgi:hypothetical protein